MKSNFIKNFLILTLLLTILTMSKLSPAQTPNTQAGINISNFAQASYRNGGQVFNTVSPTVSFNVQGVSAVRVTPDETQPSAVITANQLISRKFQVCNSSNIADSYTIKLASVTPPAQIIALYYDIDNNGLISNSDTLISLNNTQSPIVNPGACINVLVDINTNNMVLGDQLVINLTARSTNNTTANGPVEDEGTIINSTGRPVTFTDPNDPTLIPLKTVENVKSYVANKNQPLNYLISFRNNGEVDARNVVINDNLPNELTYIANSLRVDGRSLTDAQDADEGSVVGKLLTVKLANPVAPGQVVQVRFQALVSYNDRPGAGIVNTAQIGAINAPTVNTSQAIVVIDPFGTVYAARGGASSPISGARVAISTSNPIENLLGIPAGQGFDPNTGNTNPYLTATNGRFSFGLNPDQLGTITQPVTYYVNVSANGFRPRLIQITLRPDGNGLFKMTVKSLDGMPVAIANGFELTENDVEISSIADVAFNIPMFENATLELIKTADRVQVEIGDIINYRIETHNASVAPVYDAVITDTLPDSFSYAQGTAQIVRGNDKQLIEPEVLGNTMRFKIGEIKSGERFSITYRVKVGVNVRQGDNYNSAFINGCFISKECVQTTPTKVGVKVNPGMFSMRQFVIGRVFIDDNGNQTFDAGEKPVVGARIYMANGESVITDSQGMYNLPAVSEGAQVLALDQLTLPEGYLLADSKSKSGKDWTRLVRTPLGGGAMLRQNFVLVASKANPPVSSAPAKGEDAKNLQKSAPTSKTADAKLVKADFVKDEKKDDKAPKTEEYHRVDAGDVMIHSLVNNQVIMTPALNLEVSVAEGWKTEVQLNGQKFGGNNIGTTREDKKNQITTYTYVGLGVKPGPNTLTVTAVGPNGEQGKTVETKVYGRGGTKRIEIIADKKSLQASGRDSTRIFIKAYDDWGHPAQDTSILIKTSAGRLIKFEEYEANSQAAKENRVVIGQGLNSTAGVASEQVNQVTQEQSVEIVGGIGTIKLISDSQVGSAKLLASSGSTTAESEVQFTPEMRDGILTSVAEVTIGKNAPEMQNRNVEENVRAHVQLFYKGPLFNTKNMLTLAYDSQQPLNRVSGRDRMFQLNPLDRVYPIFGDSSTRFQETESNSKVFARLDRGRSYAMFGDFTADMENNRLLSYGRKLTGVKVHLENEKGDFVTITGARPDTSFARQIIPGGTLGIVQLERTDLMPGSEQLMIETRDRRNPELIISREALTRGLDYNIDTNSGTIFFLRPINTFDRDLNLVQVVATYEYRSNGMESTAYTARGSKMFNRLGLRLGFSYIDQKQSEESPFRLGGLDATLNLPNRGKLTAEFALSNGSIVNGFSFFGNNPNGNKHNGNAFFVNLEQPLKFWQSTLRFEGTRASEGFYNPFGATVTPGSTRGAIQLETKPMNRTTLKFSVIGEKNETVNVDNNRVSAGVQWSQTVNEKIRLNFGYDFRRYEDNKDGKVVSSNLVSVGADFKPTDKLDFSVKREQNLGDADPSFPNQTLLQANYRINNWAKMFFTQRFSSAAITPIADLTGTGFATSKARNETAVGVESQWGKYTSMSGRYQIENGINGTDSFAVVGLQNRLPINKVLSLELGFERAFHLAGEGKSYNNVLVGANWLPNDNFRSSVRYEFRNRDGNGQIFTLASAGEFRPGWTALGRFQYGNINFQNRTNKIADGQAAMAIRPHDTDKYGLLFSYEHRDSSYSDGKSVPTSLKSDILSSDGFYQPTQRLELYGRFAWKLTGDGNSDLPYASSSTYLLQGRAQYRIARYFDIAAEDRYIFQPNGSNRNWFGVEGGYWATSDLRLGVGYNFSHAQEPYGFNNNNQIFNRSGFYFVISTKLSRLFNLFGTKKDGLQYYEEENNQTQNPAVPTKKNDE